MNINTNKMFDYGYENFFLTDCYWLEFEFYNIKHNSFATGLTSFSEYLVKYVNASDQHSFFLFIFMDKYKALAAKLLSYTFTNLKSTSASSKR